MKILIDGRVLAHKDITGIQRHAHELSKSLKQMVDVDIAIPKYKNRYYQQIWEHTLLPWYAREYNLLFCPSNIAPFWTFSKTKLVITLHDLAYLDHSDDYSFLFQLYYRYLVPYIVKRSEKVITISDFSKNRIFREFSYLGDKLEVIHHGISSEFASSMYQKEDYVLYVGAMNEIKNFQSVLEIFMSSEFKDIRLKMILPFSSSFTQSNYVKKLLIDSKKHTNIQIIDHITQDRLIEYYQKAKLFVFPSFHESFGFPPLEAMACGTPVVVSKVGAISEICLDCVLYVDPDDIEDIKQKLLELYHDEKLQKKLLDMGLTRARDFSWESCAQRHIEVFKEVLK